jgi:4-hydroxymandelate oxidase
MKPINIEEWERAALERLEPMARAYFAGGARDEITLRENQRVWDQIWLHYRVLVDVSNRSTRTTVLGQELALPIIAAPTAFQRLAHTDGELATTRALANSGSIFVLSTLSTVSIEDVAAEVEAPRWFQLYVYRDREITRSLVERAEAAGYEALVLTVDAAEIGTRERDARHTFHLPEGIRMANLMNDDLDRMDPVADQSALSQYVREQLDPSLTWADVDWLANQTSLPIVVKGLVRPDDAQRAVDHGARAIAVSNHGGRQLDTAPPTAHVLPAIIEQVGAQAEVLVDGGIRRGTDVIKALAMGARAVMIGRPVIWGLAVDGQQGIENVFETLRLELLEAMALCGCPDIPSIGTDLLGPPPST